MLGRSSFSLLGEYNHINVYINISSCINIFYDQSDLICVFPTMKFYIMLRQLLIYSRIIALRSVFSVILICTHFANTRNIFNYLYFNCFQKCYIYIYIYSKTGSNNIIKHSNYYSFSFYSNHYRENVERFLR